MKRALSMMIILACAVCGFTQDKAWPQEPTSFRSVPFGASEKEAGKIVKTGLCFNATGDRGCSADFELAGIAIHTIMIFRADQFTSVQGKFPSDSYSTLRQVFVEKYGIPSDTKQSTIQNRAGAKFSQESLIWDGPKIRLQISHYGDTVTEGEFSLVTQKMRAEILKDADAKTSKAKDDL